MNIEKEMTKLANSLKPSSMQEERVLKRVLEAQDKPNLLQLFKMKSFNLKFFTGGMLTLLVLLGLPTLISMSGLDQRDSRLKTQQNLIRYEKDSDEKIAERDNSFGGNSNDNYVTDYQKKPLEIIVDKKSYNEDTSTNNQERAKENTADVKVSTDNTKDIYDKVRSLVNEFGGYIVRSSYHSLDGQTSNIEMRVPVDKFEEVLTKIRELNLNLVSENIETLDRQNQLTETKSTLTLKEEEIKTLEEKLTQAQNQSEKDTITNQINNLKSDVKTLRSTVQSIDLETSFSTVKVQIAKGEAAQGGINLEPTIIYVVMFWSTILVWIIVPVVFTLPIWLPILIIARRKFKNKNIVSKK